MDYSFILRQLQLILTNNRISLIPIILIVVNLLFFLISRTFRKTGLFVLALAFLLDYGIKSLPFDLYYNIPWLYNAITILYILGFIIFFLKVLKMVIRMSKVPLSHKSKDKTKLGHFFSFTGLMPFLIMLVANIIGINKYVGDDIISILTSLTFLYMLVRTIHSTYNYLKTKESIVLADRMDFQELKNYLREDNPRKSQSLNEGRIVRKTIKTEEKDQSPTEIIDKKEVSRQAKVRIPVASEKDEIEENHKEIVRDSNTTSSKLSNTQLLKMVSGGFDDNRNSTSISITELSTGKRHSFTSNRPILKIEQTNEYKIDLEFETINEYDYGRFIDILLLYSKNKDAYKFELAVSPAENPNSKVIFFDPSNIYDIDDRDYANAGGKIISMNFPKYKINFISGN